MLQSILVKIYGEINILCPLYLKCKLQSANLKLAYQYRILYVFFFNKGKLFC